jgi:hypothetical protein
MENTMEDSVRTGRCLCRAVRFIARGEPRWVAHCHCESCRRATSSAIATYAGFTSSNVEWIGEPPAEYRSSPGVTRRFCRRCGSPMSFEGERWPDEIHLFLPSFDQPETLRPRGHVHVEEQLSWLQLGDHLPRYAKTAQDGPPLA